jgi:hypothetical protein
MKSQQGSMLLLEHDALRVTAVPAAGHYQWTVAVRQGEGWRVILASGLHVPPHIYTLEPAWVCEDPQFEWRPSPGAAWQREEAMLTAAALEGGALVLTGEAGGHRVAVTLRLEGADLVHVDVVARLAGGPAQVSRLLNKTRSCR